MLRRDLYRGAGAALALIMAAALQPASAADTTIRVASVTGPSHHQQRFVALVRRPRRREGRRSDHRGARRGATGAESGTISKE